jgi:hypothetical protein
MKLLKIKVTRLVSVPLVKSNGVLPKPLRQRLEFTATKVVAIGGGWGWGVGGLGVGGWGWRVAVRRVVCGELSSQKKKQKCCSGRT